MMKEWRSVAQLLSSKFSGGGVTHDSSTTRERQWERNWVCRTRHREVGITLRSEFSLMVLQTS